MRGEQKVVCACVCVCVFAEGVRARGAQGLVVCLLLVVAASCQGSSGRREGRPGEGRASGRGVREGVRVGGDWSQRSLTPNEW